MSGGKKSDEKRGREPAFASCRFFSGIPWGPAPSYSQNFEITAGGKGIYSAAHTKKRRRRAAPRAPKRLAVRFPALAPVALGTKTEVFFTFAVSGDGAPKIKIKKKMQNCWETPSFFRK